MLCNILVTQDICYLQSVTYLTFFGDNLNFLIFLDVEYTYIPSFSGRVSQTMCSNSAGNWLPAQTSTLKAFTYSAQDSTLWLEIRRFIFVSKWSAGALGV